VEAGRWGWGSWAVVASGAICALAFVVSIPLPRVDGHLIGSDGVRYYAITRSLVIDGDLDFRNDFALLGEPVRLTRTGLADNAQSIGTGLLWLPFFALAHALALVLGMMGWSVRHDGTGYLYEAFVCLGTITYATAGFLLTCRTIRRLGAGRERDAVIATLGMWWAAPAVYYVVVEPSMSHGVTVFTAALLFHLWCRGDAPSSTRRWFGLGLAVGLATLVRSQDGVLALIPIGELAWRLARRELSVAQGLRGLAVFAVAAAGCVVPQLVMWKVVYGTALTIPQGTDFFRWSRPHLVEVLFSTRHGLISWHPIFLVALVGLAPLFRRHRAVALAVTAAFLAELYVNGAATRWWADDAFGGRRFVSLVPLCAVPLAAAFGTARNRWASPALAVGLALWNGLALLQYRLGFVSMSEGLTLRQMTIDRLLVPLQLIHRLLH
jgi:hypothetical protein